jgi:hypothetical protein
MSGDASLAAIEKMQHSILYVISTAYLQHAKESGEKE